MTNPLHTPKLDKFIWYDGWAEIENKQGQWMFYNPQKPDESENMLKIDWSHKSETDARLSFENVWASHAEKGDILEYIVEDNNRSMDFWDASNSEACKIFWNAVTTAGYLHVPDYNEGLPAYWDENHQDIEGP